jgi:hypothetical protein
LGTTDGYVYCFDTGGVEEHFATGHIDFDGLAPGATPPSVLLEIWESGAAFPFTWWRIYPQADGTYRFQLPRGTFDVSVKADRWLSGKALNIGDSTQDVYLTCLGGDANGDDAVSLTDLGMVLLDFGGTTVDLNGDGRTSLTDLGLVLLNFGMVGEGQ